ncbi:N-acetylglucosamine-1-phosphotransferase subunit gamma-like [Liolophura sinensis]|uniref:N-acetylglucosamine-1-phosphotransferase subunit gamma-like n=1 Tax=Liolophura sinensis TaxID=3198878 RepID=UPI0031589EBD
MLVLLILLCCFLQLSASEQIAMKIVEEPSSYGWNNMWDQRHRTEPNEPKLTMRVAPANFSGPQHLKKFWNECFKLDDNSYSYEVCHFSNITQQEKSLRWNPYHGILGVYQEWEIENNTFVAMLYREGDRCGTSYRRVRVVFACGEKNQLTNASEPSTCHYQITFVTPYVCHPHSMLVYPTLSKELQLAWDRLEGALYQEEVTEKGYKKKLAKIFESAGYYLSLSMKKELAKKAKEEEKQKENEAKGEFDNLAKCSEEYNKLKNEVEGLRTLLALRGHEGTEHNDHNSTAKSNNSSPAAQIPTH